MTSFPRRVTIAVIAAGAVLVPAGTAFADHMPGMPDGVICPHATGEGPDALAPAAPDQPATSERAPSDEPRAAVDHASPAPEPATSEPAATGPSTRAEPAPATEVQQPATTTVQTVATTTVAAVAATPVAVAAPSRAELRRAERARERRAEARRERRAVERRARVAERGYQRGSVVVAPVGRVPAARPTPSEPPSAVLMWLLAGVFGAIAAAALGAVAWRFRGGGGAATVEGTRDPLTPTSAEAIMEAELHEMISEERARQLLEAERGEMTLQR